MEDKLLNLVVKIRDLLTDFIESNSRIPAGFEGFQTDDGDLVLKSKQPTTEGFDGKCIYGVEDFLNAAPPSLVNGKLYTESDAFRKDWQKKNCNTLAPYAVYIHSDEIDELSKDPIDWIPFGQVEPTGKKWLYFKSGGIINVGFKYNDDYFVAECIPDKDDMWNEVLVVKVDKSTIAPFVSFALTGIEVHFSKSFEFFEALKQAAEEKRFKWL